MGAQRLFWDQGSEHKLAGVCTSPSGYIFGTFAGAEAQGVVASSTPCLHGSSFEYLPKILQRQGVILPII